MEGGGRKGEKGHRKGRESDRRRKSLPGFAKSLEGRENQSEQVGNVIRSTCAGEWPTFPF